MNSLHKGGVAKIRHLIYEPAFGPKNLEPSEAAEGMGPPPGGYIRNGSFAETLVNGLQGLTH